MRQKLKYQDCIGFLLVVFITIRCRAHSELCNQNRNEKYRQKDRPNWYFNKCLIPNLMAVTREHGDENYSSTRAPYFIYAIRLS